MSVISLVFRFQVHQSEADATYLLSGTFLVTYVFSTVIKPVQLVPKLPLTPSRTIEEEIGLMCTCMPFFPAIVNNSPILSKCIHSIASLGSILTLRSGHHSSTSDRRSYQKHVSRDGSVEEGLEFHEREAFTNVALPESPKKTPRMETGGFERDERAQANSAYRKV